MGYYRDDKDGVSFGKSKAFQHLNFLFWGAVAAAFAVFVPGIGFVIGGVILVLAALVL